MAGQALLRPGSYVVDDVVAAVLVEAGVDAFTGDSSKIHATFFKVRDQFPPLQKMMAFATHEVFPFSRDLEEALTDLEVARIIGMQNPDYDRYLVKTVGQQFVRDHILPLFSEEEVSQIQAMARVFAEECGIEPQPR